MTELRHGYTLADLHSLARLAVHTAGTMASDWHDRYETAWSAIAEHLYAAEHWPQRYDLVRAGQLAIYASVTDERHHHGYFKHKTIGGSAGPCSSPAFRTYWADLMGTARSPERRIVERVALYQILATLTPGQRDAIVALAAHGDLFTAAAAVGMTYAGLRSQVAHGRRRFLALWHEGEQPSRPWGQDRRVVRRGAAVSTARTALDAVRRRRSAAGKRAEAVS